MLPWLTTLSDLGRLCAVGVVTLFSLSDHCSLSSTRHRRSRGVCAVTGVFQGCIRCQDPVPAAGRLVPDRPLCPHGHAAIGARLCAAYDGCSSCRRQATHAVHLPPPHSHRGRHALRPAAAAACALCSHLCRACRWLPVVWLCRYRSWRTAMWQDVALWAVA